MTDRVAVDRESMLVQLVDNAGATVGTASVSDAHAAPGRPHRAFSVVLDDGAGRILVQRRAAIKTRFPSRWSNACCGHPEPNESVVDAATARLADELRMRAPLTEVGVYRYRAEDPATRRVEDEYDHVLVGTVAPEPMSPNPAEVSEVAWMPLNELRADLQANPQRYTPWFAGVLAAAADR